MGQDGEQMNMKLLLYNHIYFGIARRTKGQ